MKQFKPNFRKILFTSIFCLGLYFPYSALAQIGGPPPPFADDVNDEAPLPIDGFVVVSLIAGGIYGIKKNRKNKE